MARGADAERYVAGLRAIVAEIREKEWAGIRKASRRIADTLARGHNAYFIAEGHITPIATTYGSPGNPHVFGGIQHLLQLLAPESTMSLKGTVVVIACQFDGGSWLDSIAARSKLLGAYTVFVGAPSDRDVVPLNQPSQSLSEICDMTINVHSPPRDGLLHFNGLEVPACPTSGITEVIVFHLLSLEVAEILSKRLTSGRWRELEGTGQDEAIHADRSRWTSKERK